MKNRFIFIPGLSASPVVVGTGSVVVVDAGVVVGIIAVHSGRSKHEHSTGEVMILEPSSFVMTSSVPTSSTGIDGPKPSGYGPRTRPAKARNLGLGHIRYNKISKISDRFRPAVRGSLVFDLVKSETT